jgi:hypothetical protein
MKIIGITRFVRGYVSGGKAEGEPTVAEALASLDRQAASVRKNLNAAHVVLQDARQAGDTEHADAMQRAIASMENNLMRIARERREIASGFDTHWSYR